MMSHMLEFAMAGGSLAFLVVVIAAVRGKVVRAANAAPAYATGSCAECGASVNPGEGHEIRGETYCGGDCARWAW